MHWHLNVTFREDANTTLDRQAAQNQNIIRKWSLSILKTMEIMKPGLSIEKETICNQSSPDKAFGGSVVILKKVDCAVLRNEHIHVFVVHSIAFLLTRTPIPIIIVIHIGNASKGKSNHFG